MEKPAQASWLFFDLNFHTIGPTQIAGWRRCLIQPTAIVVNLNDGQ